jgi:hypothetical protein
MTTCHWRAPINLQLCVTKSDELEWSIYIFCFILFNILYEE